MIRNRICRKKGSPSGTGKLKKTTCYYVTRNKKGQIVKVTNIGKATKADSRTKARFHPKKPGYGYKGDY